MWGRPSSDCSRKCSRIPAATRATISCPVSNAFGYALVAALGNVVGALAVTRRAARELALIEHFVAFGAGFMLAVALVEVLPEAFARSGTAAPALVLAGYLAVHFTQHTLTPHFHFGEETHARSEEHTSELQSRLHLVCRLLLEKKKNTTFHNHTT